MAAPKPSNIFPNAAAADRRRTEQLKRAFDDGVLEGRRKARKEFLDYLERRYTAKDAPDRGTPEARAILVLAKDVGQYFTGSAQH